MRPDQVRPQTRVPPPRALFVIDLDGTLLDLRGTVHPGNREAMRQAADDGIALAIVTGRRRSTFRAARDALTGVRFRSSVSDGAVLLAPDNETIERVHPLQWEPILTLLSAIPRPAAARCLAVTVPGEGDVQEMEFPDALIITNGGDYYRAPSLVEPELQEVREENAVSAASARSCILVHAALHIPQASAAGDLVRLAETEYPGATVYSTRPPRATGILVHIVAAGGKALAVRDLAASLGVDPDVVGAIGDGVNDVSLLAAAGHRYAIAGSELAAAVPSAVPVAGRSAVAQALRRFARSL